MSNRKRNVLFSLGFLTGVFGAIFAYLVHEDNKIIARRATRLEESINRKLDESRSNK